MVLARSVPALVPPATTVPPVDAVDAAVVGSGPNGLAGALTLARAGHRVAVYEGAHAVGGGCLTAELTLPGFRHDVCSAVHPLVLASPFFQSVDLAARGVKMLTPNVAFAHPSGRRAGGCGLWRRGGHGREPRRRRQGLLPVVRPPGARHRQSHPDHPGASPVPAGPSLGHGPPGAARACSPRPGWPGCSRPKRREALLAGAAAHSLLALDQPLTGSYALLFVALGHTYGWPVVEGGSGRLVDALVAELAAAEAEFHVGRWVKSIDELGRPKVALMDISPRQLADLVRSRATAPRTGNASSVSATARACARSTGR